MKARYGDNCDWPGQEKNHSDGNDRVSLDSKHSLTYIELNVIFGDGSIRRRFDCSDLAVRYRH